VVPDDGEDRGDGQPLLADPLVPHVDIEAASRLGEPSDECCGKDDSVVVRNFDFNPHVSFVR
jgi:hypothetical protein